MKASALASLGLVLSVGAFGCGSQDAGKGGSAGSSAAAAGAGNGSAGRTSGGNGAGASGGAAGKFGAPGGAGGGAGSGAVGGGEAGGSAGVAGGAGEGATGGKGMGGAAGTGGVGGRGGQASGGMAGSGAGTAGSGGMAPLGNPVVYVGGFDYSSTTSYPFTIFDFERATGKLTARPQTINLGPNPSYIALAPSAKYLYVTNESDDAAGGITAAAIGADGTLALLEHQTGSDGGFTYLRVAPNGKFVLGASYNGGSASVFPLGNDGNPAAQSDNRDFGSGAQTHCIAFDQSGEHVLIVNKGNDEIAQLSFSADGKLTPNTPASVKTASGAGPRHIALHPNGTLAFVIDELDSKMVPYALAANGTLTAGTAVSTLPAGFSGKNTGAHVELSPDGHFVFGSNRGHDSIVSFAADQSTGALTLVGHQPSGGKSPRDFDVDPYGEFLIAANQDTETVAAFHLEADGSLTPLGEPVSGPPGCAAVQIFYPP
jgi:6-phosphogluconolactonase